MAEDICRVVLTGRLTKDAELRHTPSGAAVCSMRLAYTTREKRNDEWVDHSNYIDVTLWGNRAEAVVQYLVKGKQVGVDGTLRWREWDANDGTKRQAYEVTNAQLVFLGSRGDGDGQQESYAGGSVAGADHFVPTGAGADDDIPF